MYIVTVKTCEAPVGLCAFYRPAHHTEHNQLPHIHVHSCTCRWTVLCYTVIPIYTRMFFLNRTVLLLYTSTVIQYIWPKFKNILFHNPSLRSRRFMTKKIVRSLGLLLLLVLLMLLYNHHHSHQHHQDHNMHLNKWFQQLN